MKLSNEEKLQILSSILFEKESGNDNAKIQGELRALLLRDTEGGKLYKYRIVGKHALESLETQTLYCSKPSAFNDPFDCRIGVDFQSLIDAKSEITIEPIMALWERYLQFRCGDVASSALSDEEKAVFHKWDHNAKLNELLSVESSRQFDTEEEHRRYLSDCFDAVLEMFQPILENSDQKESFDVIKRVCSKLLVNRSPEGVTRFFETPFKLLEYAKANLIKDDTDEIGRTLALNRQFGFASEENAAKADTTLTQLGQRVAKTLDDLFYIGCLCPDNKNRLMWSHYADCHKGFCIEYDFSQAPDDLLPLPVIYTNKRPQIPWRAAIQMNDETRAEANRVFMMALLTKDAVWDYEREWRLLISSTMDQRLKMPPISCIYLGVQCPPENAAVIMEIAARKSIPVKKMIADRGEYELHCSE